MTEHPERDMISSWLDGQVPAQQRQSLNSHLTECAPCRQEARDIDNINYVIRGWYGQEILPPVPQFSAPPVRERSMLTMFFWAVAALLLSGLSYSALQVLAGWSASFWGELERLVMGELARLLGHILAALWALVNNPAFRESVLWRALSEGSAFVAIFGAIILVSQQRKAEVLLHEGNWRKAVN